jgi:predicted aspartyl protease
MKEFFESRKGLILLKVKITGRIRSEEAIFALDTGATKTVINIDLLKRIGYTAKDFSNKIMITTGSGKANTHLMNVRLFEAFSLQKRNFSVLAYQLPVTTYVEGLLGLDFIRNRKLILDFVNGSIELV